MENGNTATQVSPVTTEELNMVQSIFERMARSIVDASHVTNDLSELRHELNGLRSEVNSVRERNRELDEQVVSVRRERDEAKAEVENLKAQLGAMELASNTSGDEALRLRRDLEQAQALNVELRRERDDMGFKHMEAEDRLSKAKEWIDGVCRLFNNPPSI